MAESELAEEAKSILKNNDRGAFTVPSKDLYPHQWLWDSCFVSIGLRHYDTDRAMQELFSLQRGQWSNGMMPNIIFSSRAERREKDLWRSYLSPYSPDDVATSGITQPPMLAEAVLKIGQKLKLTERRTWYKQMLPCLVDFHEWLYRDRDPHQEGLILLLHPYESGLDNSPAWISELHKHNLPAWITVLEKAKLDNLINYVRRDTQHIQQDQRMSNIDAMAYWAAIHRLRRKAYNSEALLSRSLFAVEDLVFNSILIRANDCLVEISKAVKTELPDWLLERFEKTNTAIEELWDEATGQYYSRSFASHKLIEEPSIATLLPLYSGAISKERAKILVDSLSDEKWFNSAWPVPTVPLASSDFNPVKYWQGPAWVNTNWLIIEGLERYGYKEEAKSLRDKTLELVKHSGFFEYFHPVDGTPLGAPNFSWTAALTIDLLNN